VSDLLDIGRSLAPLRRASGRSQRDLAEAIGTTQQQVARWEASGYRSASLERVAAVAAELGAPLSAVPLAVEAGAEYALAVTPASPAELPVRDLGAIVARLRSHGDVLRGKYAFERLSVFGSFAIGEQTSESDVDLLVETSDPGGLRFVEAVLFLEQLLGRRVDLVRPHLLHDSLRHRIESEVVGVWSA